MCSAVVKSSSELPKVFYGAPDGVLHRDLGPGARSVRDNLIQSVCNALFTDISFFACCWYEQSIDHLVEELSDKPRSLYGRMTITDQTSKPIVQELDIKAKIAKLSNDHLQLLSNREFIAKSSDSRDMIAFLYKAAGLEIPFEHPQGPCVCEVD